MAKNKKKVKSDKVVGFGFKSRGTPRGITSETFASIKNSLPPSRTTSVRENYFKNNKQTKPFSIRLKKKRRRRYQ